MFVIPNKDTKSLKLVTEQLEFIEFDMTRVRQYNLLVGFLSGVELTRFEEARVYSYLEKYVSIPAR